MNEQLLEEIGLTKGEIKVYLTLLKTRLYPHYLDNKG